MHKRLVFSFLYMLFTGMAVMAGFNYIVDPYGIYQAFLIKGFNEYKPERYANSPRSKLTNVLKIQPQTLLLGTSRTEFGIDPNRIDWPLGSRPVYNMALGLSGFEEMNRILDVLINVNPPENLIIGLDFISFAHAKKDDRLGGVSKYNHQEDTTWSVLSFGALLASVRTLLSQNEASHLNYQYNGTRTSRFYDDLLSRQTHRDIFHNMTQRYNYKKVLSLGFESNIVRDNFDSLTKLLSKAKEHKINVILFISPIHVELLREIYTQKAWKSFQDIKKRLTYVLADKPFSAEIKLWDFSMISEVTQETVPDRHTDTMKWYYDSAHYKPELGKLVMDIIFAEKQSDIGVMLTADRIDFHLKEQTKKMTDLLKDSNG